MTIPTQHRERCVYHFTPLDNLPTILRFGLLSISEKKRLGLPLRTIVWDTIQAHRAALTVPIEPGGIVEDYVPFFFTRLSPMLLAVLSNKVVDEEHVIHLEFPISIMEQYPSIFTDAPTIPGSEPNFYAQPADLEHLNWEVIDSPIWQTPPIILRSQRLAELLIHRQLPVSHAERIIVWDNLIAEQVAAMFAAAHLPMPRIETDPSCYFIDRSSPQPAPLVLGPAAISQRYRAAIAELQLRLGHAATPRFADLFALRDALRSNFSVLPETAELVGLETDNKTHFEDVGSHTRRVVTELRKTPEYEHMNEQDQMLLEIVAFLHDIGKGPKSRWADNDGKQMLDPDHPIRALPMLHRILTEEVREVSLEDAILIDKLIAYHDLVGGILFSGRRLQEIYQILESERELDMLIGLGRADSTAINPDWSSPVERAQLRAIVLQELQKSPDYD
jgi:hypothetical protein